MRKLVVVFASVGLFFACNQAPKQPVNVEGNWTFKEHVKGNAELNTQNEAMINSIVSLFEGGTISMQEGKVNLKSPVAGDRSGTYMVNDGKLDVAFGSKSQFSLHVANQDSNLVILFNENGEAETGKIVLVKE